MKGSRGMGKPRLTATQRERLKGLTGDWQRHDDPDWRAGITFLRLEDRGLCEMKSIRIKGGDVTTGPGNTSVYRWHTRITDAGRAALKTGEK